MSILVHTKTITYQRAYHGKYHPRFEEALLMFFTYLWYSVLDNIDDLPLSTSQSILQSARTFFERGSADLKARRATL